MISSGNTGAISHTRALPIPTKPVGNIPPVTPRSGHKPIKCGTQRGYDRHRELGTRPCEDCLRAVKAKPIKVKPQRPKAKCGTLAGYSAHRNTGTPICDPCRKARHEYDAQWRKGKSDRQPFDDTRARGPRFDMEKAQALRDAGHTISEVAKIIGVSDASIARWTRQPPREDRYAKLLELHAQGLPDKAIAQALGLDNSRVSKRLRRMGLAPNLPPINHGTYGGARSEARRGIPLCDECREAKRAYDAANWQKRRAS